MKRGQQTYLRPIGIWYDLRAPDIIQRAFRRQDSPLHDEYPADSSINDFMQSECGRRLSEAAMLTPQSLLLEIAADGVTVFKFKHHTTTVIVLR